MKRLREKIYRVLRWSEKYTRTDMLYLTKGGFWLSLKHFITLGSGLVLSIAFANLIPKDVFGTYQFVMSMAGVIGIFSLTQMSTAVTRAVAQGKEGALRTGFRARLKWSAGIVIAGAVVALYYYINDNKILAYSFLIVGSLSPFLGCFNLAQAYLSGKQLHKENTLLGSWRRIIPFASILTTLYLTNNVVTIVLVYFLSNVISSWLVYAKVLKIYKIPNTKEQSVVSYSKHLSLLSLFSDLVSQLDKILMWTMFGAIPVATYTLALMPVKQMEGAFKLLKSLTFPKISQANLEILKKTLPHKANILFFITLGMVVIYIILAPFLFSLVFPDYPEAVLFSQVLSLVVLSKPRSLYSQVFAAHELKREQYVINISANILRLILLISLLPLFGIWGAVYTLLITHLYLNIATRFFFYHIKV